MAPAPKTPCRLFIGTSGYSFDEWIEAGFYPPGTPGKDMLAFYAQRFGAVEINYTWYHMPKAEAMTRMLSQVPDGFMFAVKLTRTMTHEVDPAGWRKQVEKFRHGIAPLVIGKRLLAILVQFGSAFKRHQDNRLYLAHLLDELRGLPLAVEFRDNSWANDRVFCELEKRRVTLVTVDAPDLPHLFPIKTVVTNPALFYIRFHGRNALGWRSGTMQRKFDYDYSYDELRPWGEDRIPKMADKAQTGVIFFNNRVDAQAPRNALILAEQLAGQGFSTKS